MNNSHSRPMVYGMETRGSRNTWRTVSVTTPDRKGAHGTALFRWRRVEGDTVPPDKDRYNMEWYGVSHGVGDWYQGESDRNMSEQFFDARWELVEDCLDGLAYGMSANEIRAAVSAYLIPEDEA